MHKRELMGRSKRTWYHRPGILTVLFWILICQSWTASKLASKSACSTPNTTMNSSAIVIEPTSPPVTRSVQQMTMHRSTLLLLDPNPTKSFASRY